MNKDQLHTAMESLIETIAEQHAQLRTQQGIIPRIELDIIRGNVARLYEHLTLLKKLQASMPEEPLPARPPVAMPVVSERPMAVEKSKPEPVVPVAQPEPPLVTVLKEKMPIVSFVVRPSFVAEVPPAPAPAHEIAEPVVYLKEAVAETETTTEEKLIQPVVLSDQTINMPIHAEPVAREETKPSPSHSKKVNSQNMGLFDTLTTVAGQYEEQPTLRDKISKNTIDSSLGKKFQKKPVEDLKKSIGINEKFSFINELFEGDLNAYNKAIDTLNQAAGITEAQAYINEQLMPRYGWKEDGKSYQSLTDLVERRFLK